MTIMKHELRFGRRTRILWTVSIAFFLSVCVFMFPEMEKQMTEVNDLFSSMGSFTAAFGMDRLDFGTLVGFYAVECGNILSVGGAFYAALIGISMLSKEEKDHTAEFLLSHPVGRGQILLEKAAALFVSLVVLNLVSYAVSVVSILCIGQEIPWLEMNLLHGAYFFVQLELCLICFGISAFIRSSGFGLGLGLATILYFLNIIGNISESADWVKYLTPFNYAEGADLIAEGCLNSGRIISGLFAGLIIALIGSLRYYKKDIH